MLAIQLPKWLVDTWSTYSDVIVPALVTIIVAILGWLAVTIRADAKARLARTDAELVALQKINEREDTRPELTKVQDELKRVQQSNTYLGEMFDLVFQNSTLKPEVKESLTILKNKLLYGTEDDVVNTLTTENARLNELVESLMQQINSTSSVVVENTETRTRR
jgi:predicted nuclease with TOPRIM domain